MLHNFYKQINQTKKDIEAIDLKIAEIFSKYQSKKESFQSSDEIALIQQELAELKLKQKISKAKLDNLFAQINTWEKTKITSKPREIAETEAENTNEIIIEPRITFATPSPVVEKKVEIAVKPEATKIEKIQKPEENNIAPKIVKPAAKSRIQQEADAQAKVISELSKRSSHRAEA